MNSSRGSGGPPWQPDPPPQHGSRHLAPLALVAAGVAIVIALAVTALILHDQQGSDPTLVAITSATPSATSPTTPAPAVVTVTKTSPKHRSRPGQTGPGDVRALPSGLFCRDLYADGFSYSAAVDYWRMHGQPNQMDIDRNGIPCETVYPPSDIDGYWGTSSLPGVTGLPGGLFCRDLYARGYSYADAVDYWYLHGEPARMDIDSNGIPCETVYPPSDVDNYGY
jgi:hypothetical protein